MNKALIILCGLQLSRKAQAVNISKELGYTIISVGNLLREQCISMKMPPNFSNINKLSINALKQGESNLIKHFKDEIHHGLHHSKGVVIDSLKSTNGVKYIKERYRNVFTVAFLADETFRYNSAFNRKRNDDPESLEEFNYRDKKEITFGIGELIVMADYFIISNKDKLCVQQDFKKIINEIEKLLCS